MRSWLADRCAAGWVWRDFDILVRFAPHHPFFFLPPGEKGAFGHPEAQNKEGTQVLPQKPAPVRGRPACVPRPYRLHHGKPLRAEVQLWLQTKTGDGYGF